MKRTAKAHWMGTIKEGKGDFFNDTNDILNKANYSLKTRFTGEEKGTNPEKLLAAAHAGCFTMAISLVLTEKGWTPASLDTEATLSMEGFDITGVHLSVTGTVPGISAGEFNAVVGAATQNCLISKVLNIPISSASYIVS